MNKEDFFENIINAIISLDEKKAMDLAKKAINDKMDLLEVIEKGFGVGIKKIGDLWEEGEIFLPELMLGGEIVEKSLNIMLPHLEKQGGKRAGNKIVMATIEGDIHSIGKTIVATLLKANGFEVIDLGADVPASKIVETAIEEKADVIGISALLTTTMIGQKKVIDILIEKNIRDQFKIILGGAPVSKKWVNECGADGYADNAIDAVELVKKITQEK
ncbi:MAG: cobalamin B12-binding domain-containing protein [Promethearchaeota archaeon]